jgi:hypothetical protein
MWPSFSPPREVDHNSQTVQSCISLEKTRRLHHQFQEIVLSVGPVNFLCDTSHPLITILCFRHSRTLLSSTPKFAAALQFPFSSVHRITSRLNFAAYDSLRFLVSLFHNYGTQQTGISTFQVSITKARAGFRRDCARLLRKARFMVPV